MAVMVEKGWMYICNDDGCCKEVLGSDRALRSNLAPPTNRRRRKGWPTHQGTTMVCEVAAWTKWVMMKKYSEAAMKHLELHAGHLDIKSEDVNLSNCASSVTHIETNFIQDTEIRLWTGAKFKKKLFSIFIYFSSSLSVWIFK
jgi:hypothetical protein